MTGRRSSLLLVLISCATGSLAKAPCSKLSNEAVVGSAMVNAGGELSFESGMQAGAVAYGVYLDSAQTISNFGKLRIVTSADHSDVEQMTAAGWLEGYLTAARINDHHHNLRHYFVKQLNASLDKPMQWVSDQDQWLQQQAAAQHRDDPFWQAIGLQQAQLDGIYSGYAAAMDAAELAAGGTATAAVERLSRDDLLFLNYNGELYDVIDMYESQEAQARLERMNADELYTHVALQGKCSALIKVTADLSDILFGHSTWDSYTSMTRIYKHYEFNLQQVPGGIAAQKLSFSSYPGELFSDDDFYITGAQLVVLETTNHIYNFSIYDGLTPQCVPSWHRVRAANLLAHNGSEWVRFFKMYNSGTYNNQYMVLDLKRFMPSKNLGDGLLWVVEQLPRMVEAADMTHVLARGYWPSYNVAFFPRIYSAAGYPDIIVRSQDKGREYDEPARWLMYQVNPRADIFRRDQGTMQTLDDMKTMMRYNNFEKDTFSGGHPYASVCARGDLAQKGAIPKGCYDTKVTSYRMALNMTSEVVGGPTAQGQPVFEWGDTWDGFEHRGMPNRYDFQFERQTAADLPLPNEDCHAVDGNPEAPNFSSIERIQPTGESRSPGSQLQEM